jgi:glycerophosphoryl diester phosphodiesterase
MAKIIGHRGASGLALGNTKESFLKAIEHGVDAIELDVHLSADNKLVVIHDPVTTRITSSSAKVSEQTLKELQQLKLHNGESLLSLDEALKIIGSTPVIIELKAQDSVDELLLVLSRNPQTEAIVLSFFPDELQRLREARPDIPIYLCEHFAPIAVIHNALKLHADAAVLNKWLMNPLTYRLAKRSGLQLIVYNVNSPLLAKYMLKLYPDLDIYTDHPERFNKKPTKTQKKNLEGSTF